MSNETSLARVEKDSANVWMDIQSIGEVLVKSGFFSDTRDQAQAIVKVLAGRELGFGPIASMQGVYIVKGRVTISANLVGAAIKRSGRYDYRVREMTNERVHITFFENGKPVGESEFTIEDAKAAGLSASDNYSKFPRNMLFSRALTNGARWYCPDVFNGAIYTPDELGAEVGEDGHVLGEIQPHSEAPDSPEQYACSAKECGTTWLGPEVFTLSVVGQESERCDGYYLAQESQHTFRRLLCAEHYVAALQHRSSRAAS